MTIQYIKHTTEASNLEEWGPVGIPLGETVCQLRGIMKSIPGREGIRDFIANAHYEWHVMLDDHNSFPLGRQESDQIGNVL